MHGIDKFLNLGLLFLAAGLLIWYLLRWRPENQLYPIQLVNNFTPWLLAVTTLVLLVTGLVVGPNLQWLSAFFLLLILGWPFFPLFIPRFVSSELVRSAPIKVMSYSVCSDNQQTSAVVQIIRQIRPDLILLQEVEPELFEVLQHELVDLYPTSDFHITYAQTIDQVIISCYPLTALSIIPEGCVQRVELHLPQETILVWNVHTSQPHQWQQVWEF
ncbi:MAG: endonuclease/exonuclease/phosphatase family protein [Anaerolineae bacterium]|nr:endonuclease/exonuclease/phosphatase family protein [Anaerolineae bacterium]